MKQKIKKPEFYTGLIYSMALAWNQKTGIDFQEFVSEGNMAYMDAKRLFNPEAGTKFSTFLRIKVNWEMMKYQIFCNKIHEERSCYAEFLDINVTTIPNSMMADDLYDWNSTIDKLSDAAKEIIELLRKIPPEFESWISNNSHGLCKELIKRWLVKKGWSHYLVSKTFVEIKEALC